MYSLIEITREEEKLKMNMKYQETSNSSSSSSSSSSNKEKSTNKQGNIKKGVMTGNESNNGLNKKSKRLNNPYKYDIVK